jgi:membrane-associated phospholipid phosphatase
MKTTAEPIAPGFFAVRTRVSKSTVVVVVVVAAVIVVAASAVAWDGTVPGWEADALRWVNDWPDWLEPAMWPLQQVGVSLAPVVGGLVVVSFTKRWKYLIPIVLILPLKLGIEKAVVKQLVSRERPYISVGPDIHVRGPAFEGLSFPSGHTTTAFGLAVLLAAFMPPKWRIVPITWAIVVAIARLYHGEHNLLDVVTGAALGTAFATVLWFLLLNREVPEPH